MAEASRELVRKLGMFLADVTRDRPAERIHTEILDRLRDPGVDLDHRLAGVYLHGKDFVPVWTAIRTGASLPSNSWESVVLPTVVYYSDEKAIKANLQRATSLWLAARTAISAPIELEADPHDDFLPWDEPSTHEPPPASAELRLPEFTEPDLAPARGRRWVPQAAALTIVAVAAVIWVNGTGTTQKSRADLPAPGVGRPSSSPAPSPSGWPSPSPEPSPSPSASRSVAPTPSRPRPTIPAPRPPSAPRNLEAKEVSPGDVELSWLAPADAGSDGISLYRVFNDGKYFGWTDRTKDIFANVPPGKYVFTVKAVSKSGRESAPSDPEEITIKPPATGPPPTGPAEEPSPTATAMEPSPPPDERG